MSKFNYWLDSDFGFYVHEIKCSRSDFKLAYKNLKECKCEFFIDYRDSDYVEIRYISPKDNVCHFFGGIIKAESKECCSSCI